MTTVPKVIPKNQLKHGAYYAGTSNSVTVARWNAHQSLFFGKRQKGAIVDFFTHPEDSVAMSASDTFTPVQEITAPAIRIPISY